MEDRTEGVTASRPDGKTATETTAGETVPHTFQPVGEPTGTLQVCIKTQLAPKGTGPVVFVLCVAGKALPRPRAPVCAASSSTSSPAASRRERVPSSPARAAHLPRVTAPTQRSEDRPEHTPQAPAQPGPEPQVRTKSSWVSQWHTGRQPGASAQRLALPCFPQQQMSLVPPEPWRNLLLQLECASPCLTDHVRNRSLCFMFSSTQPRKSWTS